MLSDCGLQGSGCSLVCEVELESFDVGGEVCEDAEDEFLLACVFTRRRLPFGLRSGGRLLLTGPSGVIPYVRDLKIDHGLERDLPHAGVHLDGVHDLRLDTILAGTVVAVRPEVRHTLDDEVHPRHGGWRAVLHRERHGYGRILWRHHAGQVLDAAASQHLLQIVALE